jgi:hypothetical protein
VDVLTQSRNQVAAVDAEAQPGGAKGKTQTDVAGGKQEEPVTVLQPGPIEDMGKYSILK